MHKKPQSPIWPYLGILFCLFVLCITAPKEWSRGMNLASLRSKLKRPAGTSIPFVAEQQEVVYQDTLVQRIEPLPDNTPTQIEVDSEAVASFDMAAAAEPPEEFSTQSIDAQPLHDAIALDIPPVPEPLASDWAAAVDPQSVADPQPIVPQIVPPLPEFAGNAGDKSHLQSAPESGQLQPDAIGPTTASPDTTAPTTDKTSASPGAWPLPSTLLEQLRALSSEQPAATWAHSAAELIEQMCHGPSHRLEQIAQLRQLAEHAKLQRAADDRSESQATRARFALGRWLDVWQPAAALDAASGDEVRTAATPQPLGQALVDADKLTRNGPAAAAWRDYLLISELERLALEGRDKDHERRARARQVLERLDSSRLTVSQREFVNSGPLAALQTQLRGWATQPVSSETLLEHLNQYERSGLPSDARQVAEDYLGLRWSATADAQALGESVEAYYRNANVRVAIAAPLVNRLIPQPQAVEAPVRDRVLNVPTYGRSTTSTNVSLRLVPDPNRVRIGLEASGLVASDTVSDAGAAKFRNQGQSTFFVRKLLVLGPQGLVIFPAEAQARNDFSYLLSMETEFDGMPIVGSLVRNIARNKLNESRGMAKAEVESKVACRAREQLDAEVGPKLTQAAEDLQKNQLANLHRLGLELVPLELATTEDRIVGRFRLSGPSQLGSHTPRPRALSDSWLSVQLHQSALNNALEQFDLAGRKFTMPELFEWIAEKRGTKDQLTDEKLPPEVENVSVTFAQKDPIRVLCQDGQVEVVISLAQLRQGNRSWRNIAIHATYVPEIDHLDARLVHEETSIEGVRGVDVPLRGIVSKALARFKDVSLLDDFLTDDPRFADLAISQFVVEDGWIGVAYSPARSVRKSDRSPK